MAEENLSYMEQQKKLHKNAYNRRTDEDDNHLTKLFLEEKYSLEQLAEIFWRNIWWIEARLIKLWLIEDNWKYSQRTKEDDKLLIHLYKEEWYSIEALAKIFEKDYGWINARLKKLWLIDWSSTNEKKEKKLSQAEKSAHTLDAELFSALKQKRLEIAQRNNVPAFIICYDYTLEFIVEKKPLTKEQMTDIPWIKEIKFEKYWEEFIQTIKALLATYDENGFNIKTWRHKDNGDYYNNRWFNIDWINKDTWEKRDNEWFDIKWFHKDTWELYNSKWYDMNWNKKDSHTMNI